MRWATALAVSVMLVLACGSESLKPEPIIDDPVLYWDLELNHHAVTLATTAPYDTLRLVATPRNYRGDPLTGLPAATYVSRNLERVAVRSTGTIVAVAPTTQAVWVVATVTTGNLKHTDSALVKVVANATPPVLASFSMHPLAPDSAKVSVSEYSSLDFKSPTGNPDDTLRVRATDAGGAPLDLETMAGGIPVHFRSSDPTIARFKQVSGATITKAPSVVANGIGRVYGLQPGTVTLYASTNLFGVSKADTLTYRIGLPIQAEILIGGFNTGSILPGPGYFQAPEWRVGLDAYVTWVFQEAPDVRFGGRANALIPEVDITFNDADLPNVAAPILDTALTTRDSELLYCGVGFFSFPFGDCGSGNSVLGGGTFTYDPLTFLPAPALPRLVAVRRFPVPGTYEYRSTIYGTRGRIIVVDER